MRRVSLRLVKVCAGLREALSLITRDDYLYIRVHGVLVLFSFLGWITIMVVVLVGGFLMFFFRISDIYDHNTYSRDSSLVSFSPSNVIVMVGFQYVYLLF